MSKTIDEESWNRFPEAKIRMREDGLKTILDGLGEDGFCAGSMPRIQYVEDGVYIEVLLNVGKHGSIIALPFEVFIQAKMPAASKKKKAAKEKKVNALPPPVEPVVTPAPVVELSVEPETPAGST